MLGALARAARNYGITVVALNRPLCPISALLRKRHRLHELFRRPKLELVSENLYLYSPKYFLHDSIAYRLPGTMSLNLSALRRSLENLQKRLDVYDSSPIVWYYHPQQGYVSAIYDASFNVFELYDNLARVNGESDTRSLHWEKHWKSAVDLFLATSPKLLGTYGNGYRRVIYLRNGLSDGDYLKLSSKLSSRSKIYSHIPDPRLGFAGVISERLDWNLILTLADARPDWNLVFAGRVTHPSYESLLRSRKNIYYLGEFAQAQVPEVVAEFDIGIMPYVDNDFFRYSNPLKFYEFCAAGIPSVSSPMEILGQFPPAVVRICTNRAHDWIAAIEELLESRSEAAVARARSIAKDHLWESICTELFRELESSLKLQHNDDGDRHGGQSS